MPTQNPIGSTSVHDLLFNAESLDRAINSQNADSWVDRFGKPRKTWHGIEGEARVQIGAAADAAEQARTYAEASGNIKFSDSHAEMQSRISSGVLVDGDVVEVYDDETRNHDRTRYLVSGGAPVFKFNLSTGFPTEEFVKQTSPIGAAILPEGPWTQRPTDIPNVGLVMRGSTTSGVPEYYSRQVKEWIGFGIPNFQNVPPIFCGWNILVLAPHMRYMVWNEGQRKYVRAPWHQPGQLSYFLRHVPPTHVEVRADILLDSDEMPDLADYLGIPKGQKKFVIDEVRGEFLRTLDSGRGIDPGRNPGSWQADELKAHNHWNGGMGKSDNYSGNGTAIPAGNGTTAYTSMTGGGETRGRNITYRLAVTF